MREARFSQEQIDEMLKNQYVHRCSEKSVTYAKEFKMLAVRQYNVDGLSATAIFRDAGINLQIIGKRRPKNLLCNWNKIYRTGNGDRFDEQRGKNSRGGGRPRTKGVTDADRIQKLEAEVAYLRTENDFLARLRARRAESNSGQGRNTSS